MATKGRVPLAIVMALSLTGAASLELSGAAAGRPGCPSPRDDDLGNARVVQWPRVRPTTLQIAGLLLEGLSRSPTLGDLVDRLQASDVIVYVSMKSGQRDVAGSLVWVGNAGKLRYLHAFVTAAGSTVAVIAALGHELAHAIEMAEADWVRSAQQFAILYSSIGEATRSGNRAWDTRRAYDAGERIQREFVSSGRGRRPHALLTQPIDWYAVYRCSP